MRRLPCGKLRPLVAALILLANATAASAQPGVQTLTSDDLARAGITRLSDIFALAGTWSTFSTEDYHWDAAPLGVTWETSSAWKLFVDESPVDLRALGRQSINGLPLSLSEVCTVQLHTLPVIIGGLIAAAGAIHLQTCPVTHGLSARGVLGVGNETGDPGPWRYTDFGGPNVDRTGPTIQGVIAGGGRNWHLRAQAILDEHHATDPRIRTRVRTLYVGEKDARIFLRAGRASFRLGTHTITGAAARTEDLRYSETLGLEAPVNHETAYVRANGTWRKMGYRLSGMQSNVLTRRNLGSVNVDFEQNALRAHLYGRFTGNRAQAEFGIRGAYLRTIPFPVHNVQMLTLGSVYGQLDALLGRWVKLVTMGSFSIDGRAPGYSAFGSLGFLPADVRLTIAMNDRSYAGQHDLAYWLTQGYQPTSPGSLPVELQASDKREQVLSADLSWHRRRDIELSFTGGFRRHRGYPLLSYAAIYDSLTTGLKVATTARSIAGNTLRGEAELRMPLGHYVTAAVHAAYAYIMAGQHEYRAAWHQRVLAYAQVDFAPNPRFTLHARARYRGVSNWPDYSAAAQAAPEHYAFRMPAAVLVDLTAQKRLWGERLRLSATLRNLADHSHISHPAGSRTRLLFQIRIQYRFEAVI